MGAHARSGEASCPGERSCRERPQLNLTDRRCRPRRTVPLPQRTRARGRRRAVPSLARQGRRWPGRRTTGSCSSPRTTRRNPCRCSRPARRFLAGPEPNPQRGHRRRNWHPCQPSTRRSWTGRSTVTTPDLSLACRRSADTDGLRRRSATHSSRPWWLSTTRVRWSVRSRCAIPRPWSGATRWSTS